MDLPPEVRNIIYGYCLIVAGEIVPYPTIAEKADEMMTPKCAKPATALLAVSRSVRDESRPHLYGRNIWKLSFQTWPRLPTTVWQANLGYFRHVTTSFDHRDITNEYRLHYCNSQVLHHFYHIGPEDVNIMPYLLPQTFEVDTLKWVCEYKLRAIHSIMSFNNIVTVHLDFKHTMELGSKDRSDVLKKIREIPTFAVFKRSITQPSEYPGFQRSADAWQRLMKDQRAVKKSNVRVFAFSALYTADVLDLFF
ncbi:MAG: hypothetical protein Q9224_006490 [Gallowayella concinna]